MTRLNRSIERWRGCDPEAMAYHQSQAAIKFAFEDAKHDMLAQDDMIVELRATLHDILEWLDDGNRVLSDACRKSVEHADAVILKSRK